MFKQAKWIWMTSKPNKDEYGEFCSRFTAEKQKTICRLSCDSDYTLFINGRVVERNQYGDFEHYKIYDEIDITDYIENGENVFAVLVWYIGEDFQRYKTASAGLIFEIEQDSTLLLVSNENILSRKSKAYLSGYKKQLTAQLGFSFLYDATKEDDWFWGKGQDFMPSVCVDKHCQMFPRPIKKLTLLKRKDARILKNEGMYYLIDLGEETVGLPMLEFSSLQQQKLLIAWGEDLQDEHVRRIIGKHHDFSYEYIARVGDNCYTNHMLRISGRYLEVYAEKLIELKYCGIIPQIYPVKDVAFSLDDKLDQSIYDICVRTLKLSMMEHYVDTPWREQCLYAFDARNQMLCGYYAFEGGNAKYARSNLKLISEDRRADGLLSICYPCGKDLTIPTFSLYYFMAVREYLDYTGDMTLAEEVYPKLISILDVFLAKRKNGLVYKFSGRNHWNFYDWSKDLVGRLFEEDVEEPDLIINCLFIIALENLKKIDKNIGKIFVYDAILEETRLRTKQVFYNKEKEAYSLTEGGNEFTALGNAFAILSGLADNAGKLCDLMMENAFTECSLSMKCFQYDALLLTNREKWQDAIFNQIRKDYKIMLDAGATSVWETLDGAKASGNSGSLCHGWSAIPVYYYRNKK